MNSRSQNYILNVKRSEFILERLMKFQNVT